jgi:hypothetical protein
MKVKDLRQRTVFSEIVAVAVTAGTLFVTTIPGRTANLVAQRKTEQRWGHQTEPSYTKKTKAAALGKHKQQETPSHTVAEMTAPTSDRAHN